MQDPDARVREAIAFVFQKLRELQNGRQLFMWFYDQGVEIPTHQYVGGKLRTQWRVPTALNLVGIIKNPFYAGAYVYGRRPSETVIVDGRVVSRVGKLRPPEACRVFIPDHHEAYIGWSEYKENEAILRRNAPRRKDGDAVTAARSGHGLLVGLLRCGHCGRKLHVNYWGRSGTSPRYICKGAYADAGDGCLSFAGTLVERSVEQQILVAICGLGVEASLLARESISGSAADRVNILKRRDEQLRYDASRAFEQYDEVDPKNRLVAAELERRWNVRLAAAEAAEAELTEAGRRTAELDEASLARVQYLGEHFEEAWRSPACSGQLKKKIVRTAIEEVVVRRDESELLFVVHWAGGVHTELRFNRPAPGSHRKTPVDAVEVIRTLAPRHNDRTIAAVLNINGMLTGHGKKWNVPRVISAKRRYGIKAEFIDAEERGLLSLRKAATYCGVSQQTIHKLIASGMVCNEQTVPRAPLELRKSDLDSEPAQSVLERLRATGRLDLGGALAKNQIELFTENQGVEDARYSE